MKDANILCIENYVEYVPCGCVVFYKLPYVMELTFPNHSEFCFMTKRGYFISFNRKKTIFNQTLTMSSWKGVVVLQTGSFTRMRS
jgi:hypothetical protein